jgi:Xaa-Pro aminopeptidase
MVLAIETPYTSDVGTIMIENLVLVPPHSIERLHGRPHGLTSLPT